LLRYGAATNWSSSRCRGGLRRPVDSEQLHNDDNRVIDDANDDDPFDDANDDDPFDDANDNDSFDDANDDDPFE
jgi:hypothetical protein